MASRAALLVIGAAGFALAGCNTTGEQQSFSGPSKTISGVLNGPPYSRLTPSSIVFITAYDASSGTPRMTRITGRSFTLNQNARFPIRYDIAVPANGPSRIALAVEIRRANEVLFSNDRLYSQTTGTSLNIPMSEAPPRLRIRHF